MTHLLALFGWVLVSGFGIQDDSWWCRGCQKDVPRNEVQRTACPAGVGCDTNHLGPHERFVHKTCRGQVLGALRKSEDDSLAQGDAVKIEKSWKGHDSKLVGPAIYRVLTKDDWLRIWKTHFGEGAVAPEVDFDKSMCLAVFEGKAGEGIGALAVKRVNSLQVFTYEYSSYPTGKPDTNLGYGIVQIPKSSEKVVIRRKWRSEVREETVRELEATGKQ